MIDVLIKRGGLDTDMNRGKMIQRYKGKDSHVTDERHLQAKECQQIPEAMRGKEVFSLELSERAWSGQHFHVILLTSKIVSINFCCFKPPSFGYFITEVIVIQKEEHTCTHTHKPDCFKTKGGNASENAKCYRDILKCKD